MSVKDNSEEDNLENSSQEEELDLTTSIFHTDKTKRIEIAVLKEIPSKFVIPFVSDDGVKEYVDVIDTVRDVMTEYIPESGNLSTSNLKTIFSLCFNIYKRFNNYLSAYDILVIMINVISETGIPDDTIDQIISSGIDGNVGFRDSIDNYSNATLVLSSSYNEWQELIERDRDIHKNDMINIRFLESQLLDPEKNTPDIRNISDNPTKLKFHPQGIDKLGNIYTPEPIDIFYIFETSVACDKVPFITMVDGNGDNYYKIYQVGSINDKTAEVRMNTSSHVYVTEEVDPTKYVDPKGQKELRRNMIRITLWTGSGSSNSRSLINSSNMYISILYKIEKNSMSVRIDKIDDKHITTVEEIQERLKLAFPVLSFNKYDITGSRSVFELWDVTLDEELFIYQLFNDENLSKYIYLDSRKNPYWISGEMTLRYISSMVTQQRMASEVGIKISIEKRLIQSKENIDVVSKIIDEDGNVSDQNVVMRYPANTFVVRFIIKNGVKIEVLKLLKNLLRALFGYHADNIDEFNTNIRDVLGPKIKGNKVNIPNVRASNIKVWNHKNFPNVLTANYNTICNNRPKLYSKNDNETFYFDKKGEKKAFPTFVYRPTDYGMKLSKEDSGPFYLRSTDPKLPNIQIKYTQTHNDISYPYPCCAARAERSEKQREMSKTSGSILSYRDTSILDPVISNVLLSIEGGRIYFRQGSPNITDSAIASMLIATTDDIEDKNEREIIKLTRQHRNRMARGITMDGKLLHFEVAKQQLYDLNNEKIGELLKGDGYLDPRFFLRIFEEYFNINIIFFISDTYLNPPILTPPRFIKTYCCRDRSYRNTIGIITHIGTRSTMTGVPQSELITSQTVGEDIVDYTTLDTDVSNPIIYRGCRDAILRITNSIIWTEELVGIEQIGNSKDYENNYGITIIAQMLDNFGKAYMLEFTHGKGKAIKYGSLIVPPCEPYNCESISDIVNSLDVKYAIKLFGKPVSCDVLDGEIVGLWYRVYKNVDLESMMFYVKTEPTNSKQFNIKVGRRKFLNYTNDFKTSRSSKLYRYSQIFIVLSKWIMKIHVNWLYKYESIEVLTDEMFEKFFNLRWSTNDSKEQFELLDRYDMDNIDCQLPEVETVLQALTWLASITKGLVNKRKIGDKYYKYLECSSARHMQIIKESIKEYCDEVLTSSPKIIGRDNVSSLFDLNKKTSPGQIIIKGEDNFNDWKIFIKSLKGDYVRFSISDRESHISSYIFYFRKTYMLIQNFDYSTDDSISKSMDKAIYAAFVWNDAGYNPGYQFNKQQVSNIKPKIYRLENGDIILVKKSEEKYSILNYGDGKYAAMLPLSTPTVPKML